MVGVWGEVARLLSRLAGGCFLGVGVDGEVGDIARELLDVPSQAAVQHVPEPAPALAALHALDVASVDQQLDCLVAGGAAQFGKLGHARRGQLEPWLVRAELVHHMVSVLSQRFTYVNKPLIEQRAVGGWELL